jgi:diguanylate cyclase (GGDEF)-like protein
MDARAGHTVSDMPTEDLRERLASAVQRRASAIALDAVTLFPFSGAEPLEAAYCRRVGDRLVELLASAVRDGRVDPTLGLVAELYRVFQERSLPVDRLFVFVYLTERSALDDLASDAELGATSEAWPLVAQLVRRASFDVLAAYVLQAQIEPTGAVLIDPLTTLHSRPVIETVLAKEAIRAARLGHTLALILIDMDRLTSINEQHGHGVGDRLLERLGILVKGFFRQHDWVGRIGDDSIAVLLLGLDAEHASELAERLRSTVEDRLEFTDHHTDRHVRVTVSIAVVIVAVAAGTVLDPDRLMAEALAGLERAKRAGRNRVDSSRSS